MKAPWDRTLSSAFLRKWLGSETKRTPRFWGESAARAILAYSLGALRRSLPPVWENCQVLKRVIDAGAFSRVWRRRFQMTARVCFPHTSFPRVGARAHPAAPFPPSFCV